ncbi:hypothetical protein Dimus_018386 [Dionaea muscipula]
MLLTSSDSEESYSSEDGDSKEAIVMTSSKEELLDTKGKRLPRSRVPNLSPILEVENSILGLRSELPKINALPCLTAVTASGSEDVDRAEESAGTVFVSVGKSEFKGEKRASPTVVVGGY